MGQAEANAIHDVEGWLNFWAGFVPCAPAVIDALVDGKMTVANTASCVFDVAGGAVLSKAGQAVKGLSKLAGIQKFAKLGRDSFQAAVDMANKIKCKICRTGNCFAASTLVHTPSGTAAIESIRLGQRVTTTEGNRASPTDEPEPDPLTWRTVRLLLHHADGNRTEIELLRPLSWLETMGIAVGKRIWLDMGEMGAEGWAEVLSVGPCPALDDGPGQLVTATFRHDRGEILDLVVEGSDEPIGVTAGHMIWSEDRHAFVPAGRLVPGERLVGLSGTVRVVSLSPRGPPEATYNIEVWEEHVYRVGSQSVLVHNASVPPCGQTFIDGMSAADAKRYREYWGGMHDISGGQPFGMKTTVTKQGELKTVTTYDQHGRPHRQYGIREGEPMHEHGFTYPQVPLRGTGYAPNRGPQRPIGSHE
jgi:hypothetical protein